MHYEEYCHTPLDTSSMPAMPKYIIKGCLYEQTVVQYFGDAASGKSLIALDQALHIATGLPWREESTVKGQVFYLAGEDLIGTHTRIDAWLIQHNLTRKDIQNNLYIISKSINLCNNDSINNIQKLLKDKWDKISPIIIIIDTFVRFFDPSADENDHSHVGLFIHNLEWKFAGMLNACVICIHHSGHNNNGRSRGSSIQQSNYSWIYKINQNNNIVYLSNLKAKNKFHKMPDKYSWTIKSIELPSWLDQDGLPVCGPALLPHTASEPVPLNDDALLAQLFGETSTEKELRQRAREALLSIPEGTFKRRYAAARRRAMEADVWPYAA